MKRSEKDKARIMTQILITITLNVLTTLVSFLIEHLGFTEVNIVVFYILSVLFTSRFTKGYAYGVIASIMSILSFNFFFTVPLYTLKVDDSTYIFTFFVMFLSAISTSALTSKLIKSNELSSEREKQSHLLSKITESLANTSEISETAKVAAKWLSNFLDCEVLCFIPDKKSKTVEEIRVDQTGKEYMVGEEITEDTIQDVVSGFYSFPIVIRDFTLCYFCLPIEINDLDEEHKFLLYSIIMQITISMERVILIREKETVRSEVELERFKSGLLRAISHDLRTPLTRIMGTSEMLLHEMEDEGEKTLLKSIYEDASWLTRLVENILSFTRIQEGKLSIKIQNEAVEEIISEVLDWANKYYPNHHFKVELPEDVFFIPMNGKLIEQVLINLVGNAAEHTPPSQEIELSVWQEGDKAWFQVADQGIGFVEEDLPKVFDMFFVSMNQKVVKKHGLGLGLAICKTIVDFHGGEIFASNNTSGGATVKFYLNLEDENHGKIIPRRRR